MNGGGQCPNAANKTTVSGPVSATSDPVMTDRAVRPLPRRSERASSGRSDQWRCFRLPPDVIVTTPAQLEQLVERAVERVLARVPRGGATKELLSKRAAAKLLGVDRATTLETLIRAGRIRTVDVGGGPRIPRAELERVLATGVEVPHEKRRRAPRVRRSEASSTNPDDLRGLDLSKL